LADNLVLRNVVESDLAIFFDQQRDPDASHMVAFISRDPSDWDSLLTRWTRILTDPTVTMKTIVYGGVVGAVGSFEWEGEPQVTYWLGKEQWGKGLLPRALAEFLRHLKRRPLYASAAGDNVASIRVLQKCGFIFAVMRRASPALAAQRSKK
jgi:RimJ/RimL family protein N-acetyltransferase